MFGLKQYQIEAINSVFAKHEAVEKVVLYGSRAKGNFLPYSDIDMTLLGENLNLSSLAKIELEIDDLLLPYKVDISVFRDISNPDLVEHINRVGQVFYSK